MNALNKLRKITKGAVIGIIAPAGFVKTTQEIDKFVCLLEEHGYNCKLGKSLYAQKGYLAGDDALRASDLMMMFEDSTVDAILCYKGGYGTQRILPYLDFDVIKANPKLIMGFSDITVLINVIYQRASFPTVHGEMGVCMQNYEPVTFNHFFTTLTSGFMTPLKNSQTKLQVINEGVAEGVLVGGNLSLIYALMGTEYEIDLTNKILFIEDVDEETYAIDRMISSLTLSKGFKSLKGIICGYFTNCEPSCGVSYEEILYHYFKNLNIPVVYGFESGHNKPFINLPIGLKVKLDTNNLCVTVLESLFVDN